MQLEGVYFNWKDGYGKTFYDSSRQIGLNAQNVEKVLPEVVETDKDGLKSVEYSKIIGVMVEAMKEQQKQIELLTQEVQLLKSR